jgi:hypothetical protein
MSGSSHEELDSLKCHLKKFGESAWLQAETAQFRQLLGAQSHRDPATRPFGCASRETTEPLVTERAH